MNNKPFVSIIIPTVRSHEVLTRCLESLRLQDYSKDNFEVILVSFSDITSSVEGLSVKIVHIEANVGYADARNIGAAKAKGEFLAFLDDDCVAPRKWLTTIMHAFVQHKNIAVVGGPSVPFEKDELQYRVGGYMFQSPFLVGFVSFRYRAAKKAFYTHGEHLILANTVVRKSAFDSIGGFNKEQIPCEDGYFYFRISEKGYRLLYDPNSFVWHRAKPILQGLLKRVFVYGLGRGGVTARSFKTLHMAYLVPTVFVASIVLLAILSFISTVFSILLFWEIAVYMLFNIGNALYIFFAFERKVSVAFLAFISTPFMHASYGAGYLFGVYLHFTKQGKNEMELLRKFDI